MEQAEILVVDDDRVFRENLAEVLTRERFKVTLAPDGESAVRLAAEGPFDILLIDMVMPGMDGIAAIGKIRETDKNIKIILITAFATVDNAVEAIKKGADDYIQKPFKMDELIMTMRRVLEEAKFQIDLSKLKLDFTLGALANPIRRNTLLFIGSGQAVRLTDIAQKLEIEDHTKVLFHLKKLKETEIIEQREDKSYALTDGGRLMLDFLNILSKHLSVF